MVFGVVGSAMPRRSESPFTPQERDLIRLELMPRFGQEPELANGLFLRATLGMSAGHGVFDVERVVDGAVRAFLRAYGTEG